MPWELVCNNTGGGSGTVTSVSAGKGLTTTDGNAITTSGTIALDTPVSVSNGGTGLTTVGTSGQVLSTNGTTMSWTTLDSVNGVSQIVSLTSSSSSNSIASTTLGVTGTLGVINGGTGLSSVSSGYLLIGDGSSSFSQTTIPSLTISSSDWTRELIFANSTGVPYFKFMISSTYDSGTTLYIMFNTNYSGDSISWDFANFNTKGVQNYPGFNTRT